MEKKILIIDDEPEICRLCERILNARGYSAVSFLRGEDGLEKAKQSTFDLLIVDFKMPEMDGVEVVKEIRKIQPDIKIIFFSGFMGEFSLEEALKRGGKSFLPKPFTVDEFLKVVEKVLENPV